MNLFTFFGLLFGGSLLAGLLGALTGLGGGVVLVPFLTLGFHVDIRYAIGVSLISVIATSSGAAAGYVRERFFLASTAFLVTFATVRVITAMIRAGVGPFHNISKGGTHIHHSTFGIFGLLGIGYLWTYRIGIGERTPEWASRLTATLYGVAAALTLDEFALWLNLQDVYWQLDGKGQQSVWVVLAFAGLLSFGFLGGPLLRAFVRELSRMGAGGAVCYAAGFAVVSVFSLVMGARLLWVDWRASGPLRSR